MRKQPTTPAMTTETSATTTHETLFMCKNNEQINATTTLQGKQENYAMSRIHW
jgi:hypothetical protein